MPVITTNPWIHTYGNTVLAYIYVYEQRKNVYRFSGGLHGGLDLGGNRGDAVIAGVKGTVDGIDGATKDENTGKWTVTNESKSAVYLKPDNATYRLKYQHFKDINVTENQKVEIDDSLGTVGYNSGASHIHLEVREGSTSLHNPLLYFSQPLHNELLARIDGVGNPSGEIFYQNISRTIPWQSPTTQPTIPQNPGYLILERYFGVQLATPTPTTTP